MGNEIPELVLNQEAISEANEALSALVGLPLTDMYRYGYQWLELGEQKPFVTRRGEPSTRADWTLILAGDWRFQGPGGFELNNGHFAPYPDTKRTDDHAEGFYSLMDHNPLVIESILIRENGTLSVSFSQDFRLEVGPPNAEGADPDEAYPGEAWELMAPEGDPRGHLVFWVNGLEWSGHRP